MKKILVLVICLLLLGGIFYHSRGITYTEARNAYLGVGYSEFNNNSFCEYVTYENLYGAIEDLDSFKEQYAIEFQECMELIIDLEDS
jgi:hypothetical protein